MFSGTLKTWGKGSLIKIFRIEPRAGLSGTCDVVFYFTGVQLIKNDIAFYVKCKELETNILVCLRTV
jgi:hypothetical protein